MLCERDGKIDRIDPKTNKVIKTIELNVPKAGGDIAFGDGFLWVTQNGFPLTRIDVSSEKEKVAQQFWGDGGGRIVATPGAIWLSNIRKNSVSHIDPKRVLATLARITVQGKIDSLARMHLAPRLCAGLAILSPCSARSSAPPQSRLPTPRRNRDLAARLRPAFRLPESSREMAAITPDAVFKTKARRTGR